MANEKSISLQTIADAAGVSRATVSLAMRNHPRIPESTRHRIQQLAEELGYRPNAEVSRLMGMLREQRALQDRPIMALVTDTPVPISQIRPVPATWSGFAARAEALGYTPEEFQITPKLTPERLTKILHARSIRCLVFSALQDPKIAERMQLDLLCVAAIGNSLSKLPLSRCSSDKYANTILSCERMWATGSRRLALVVPLRQEERVEHTFLSGYLVFQHLHRHKGWPSPLVFEQAWDENHILDWIETHRPDGVVAAYPGLRKAISQRKIPTAQIPPIGLVNVMEPGKMGIDQRHDLIAAGAVDIVDALHKRNETGLPKRPKTMLIRGEWVEVS
jgi:LacI family transcriptional regulator